MIVKAYRAAALVVGCLICRAAVPEGWILLGDHPANYDASVDSQAVNNGIPSACLKSIKPAPEGFGTLMQNLGATEYLGKRIRLSAFVKSAGVQAWAGLWLRVDKGKNSVAFDNMQNRPIKGTTVWQRYEVVLDVPRDATGIAFGILLAQTGAVWLNSAKLEIVDNNTPTTIAPSSLPKAPRNLDFESDRLY